MMSTADNIQDARNTTQVIRDWSNAELAAELRSPLRKTTSAEAYMPLVVEALARLLEKRSRP